MTEPTPKPAAPAPALSQKPMPVGLDLMRHPFPDNEVGKLPQPTAKREEMDKLPKAVCQTCHQYHATSRVIHLDYIGHAAITNRLLDADPAWSWEPFAVDPDGMPKFDKTGGLWIRLTVRGVTRIGYGSAEEKKGERQVPGAREKEVIGDALRNAAMRFGAGLELWHKGRLNLPIDRMDPGDVPLVQDEQPADGEGQPAQPDPTPAARTTPVRRSAAAAPATKPAAKTLPAGKPAETVGVISIGQVNNIKNKIRALGLEPNMVEAMCKRLGVPADLEKIPLSRFKDVQKELDRVRDA